MSKPCSHIPDHALAGLQPVYDADALGLPPLTPTLTL